MQQMMRTKHHPPVNGDKQLSDEHIIAMLAILTVKERRWICSQISRRWEKLSRQPEANIHIIIDLSKIHPWQGYRTKESQKQYDAALAAKPLSTFWDEERYRLAVYGIQWNSIVTLRIIPPYYTSTNDCSWMFATDEQLNQLLKEERLRRGRLPPNERYAETKIRWNMPPLLASSTSTSSGVRVMPNLVTLSIFGSLSWWHLHQITATSPRLMHVIVDLYIAPQIAPSVSRLIIDQFLNRSTTQQHCGLKTFNGRHAGHCDRCYRNNTFVHECNESSYNCAMVRAYDRYCIECLADTNHGWTFQTNMIRHTHRERIVK
jgi:hypothetical protein